MPYGFDNPRFTGYRPFIGTPQDTEMILRGLEGFARVREMEEQRAALRSPRIQALISGIMDTRPMDAPMPGGFNTQIRNANVGANFMAPTVGVTAPPGVPARPLAPDSIQWTPDGQEEVMVGRPPPVDIIPTANGHEEVMFGVAPPGGVTVTPTGDATSGFGEQLDIMAPARPSMMGPRPVADLRPVLTERAPLSLAEFSLMRQLMPQFTQMQVVRESADASRARQREKLASDTERADAGNAIKLLALNIRNRERLDKLDIEKLRARTRRGGAGDLKDLELLRKTAKDAQDSMDEVQRIIASLDAAGASAAEPGSPLRSNYDTAVGEYGRARELYMRYQGIYNEALEAWLQNGRPRSNVQNPPAVDTAPAPPQASSVQTRTSTRRRSTSDLSKLSDKDLEAELAKMSREELEALANGQ